MQASMGSLSIRQALLMDPKAGITDLVISQWMTRGEELRVEGLHSEDKHLPEHDQLCLALVELDTTASSRVLQLAGEALEHELLSRDPRTASVRATLIKHVQASLGGDRFVQRQIVEHRGGELDFTQAEMDLLSRPALERYEVIMRERAALADELRAMIAAAKAGPVVETNTLH